MPIAKPTAKPNIFPVIKPDHLALLDEIAIEIEGDRHQALNHVLDLTRTARAMVPIIQSPPASADAADRDVIDEWEPA
jgi:hypothetical protein